MTSAFSNPGRTMLQAVTSLAVLGTAAYVVAPGPVTGAFHELRDRLAWSAETCALAPDRCLADRIPALLRRTAEVRESRAQAEVGLRAVSAEDARLRSLLDANLGQQALLRSRYNDAVNRGLERMNFLGNPLPLAEGQAQAASLAAEQAQFTSSLNEMLPPRREALNRARQEAILMENRLTTTVATAEAERALIASGQTMRSASALLADMNGMEREAGRAISQVRSTVELAGAQTAAQRAGWITAGANFDFQAWRGQRPQGD